MKKTTCDYLFSTRISKDSYFKLKQIADKESIGVATLTRKLIHSFINNLEINS
jgi:predicted DNA-binding protein